MSNPDLFLFASIIVADHMEQATMIKQVFAEN